MTKAFKRPDGRKNDELRKITAKVGVVPNEDGSALFAFGEIGRASCRERV